MRAEERRGGRPDVGRFGAAYAALGAGATVVDLIGAAARPLFAVAGDVLALTGRVARIGPGERVVADLVDRGGLVRAALERAAGERLRQLLLLAVETALGVIDLTELVRRHVDLDALARGIDVDAVVARTDVDAVISRADVDAVVARVDLDAILARLDLDAIVGRVDLDLVTDRLDLDTIAKRLDLDAVVERVDLDAVVARLDLAGIAREVVDAIDLTEILRQSTGVVSSDAVRGLRAEGMRADDVVAGFVSRVLRRPDPRNRTSP